ncbi:MAG: 4'-phosphopantetheinyl transferase superfamily protein [Candidatus Metalachnospira sp.]|nr:4'-phosphopantetheinyl transferase superfamily protein [Candidatus Metalachnospira sp.]
MRANEVSVTAFTSDTVKDTDVKLKELAMKYANEKGIQAGNLEIARQEYKKPYFVSSDIFFSVSHSGNYVLFALGLSELGIDIQQFKTCNAEKIAGRFFHNSEYEYLKKDNFNSFFDVWTAKESYVKYTGQGITDEYRDFSVIDENGNMGMKGICFEIIPFMNGYSVCLCTKEKAMLRLFCE